jgi:hypothetical protein
MTIRHTVGLSDPLTTDDLDGEETQDNLPHTLEEYILADSLTHFKVKVSGSLDADLQRLTRIAKLLDQTIDGTYNVTLDANETFPDVASLRELWESVCAEQVLEDFRDNILFIEQPLPRNGAFTDQTARALRRWSERPPVIIDESDDRIGKCKKALEHGYDGTSHKNVKGVFKGIAGACLVEHRNRTDEGNYVFSGEDASNIGPIALLQDFAVVGALGLDHVERNGHHYFRGLSMYPEDVQDRIIEAHGDLYTSYEAGYPVVEIEHGGVNIGSTIDAPFGYKFDIDPSRFTAFEDWTF